MTVNAALSHFASAPSPAENARSNSFPSGASVASREFCDFAVVSAPAASNAVPDANADSAPIADANANADAAIAEDASPSVPANPVKIVSSRPTGLVDASLANRPVPANRPDVPSPLNAASSASSPNEKADCNEKADYVDDAGKIDWNAALSDNERWLRSTIATRVGESAAVDEVFQDVALAATRQQAPIRDPRKIAAWLRRLATVYSLLYRRSVGRKKKLMRRYQERVPVAETAPVDADPLRWLLLEERRVLVQTAIALLSDEERRLLTLKYSEDRSYKEIAEEIGATVSAVQSKLHRARARLREKLAELAPNAVEPPT